MKQKILLVYTGGTIGMVKDKIKNTLVPFNFDGLLKAIPELKSDELDLENVSIKSPIDSSNMHPNIWVEIVEIIETNYANYDGFVILHGTDTMAYTASAFSFMLENLNKAIIFTGSQIPIGARRSDAKENLITAVEIAASGKVNEVCIYFEDQLYKANRTVKVNTEHFEAFESPNYPILAEAGVTIKYKSVLQKKQNQGLIVHKNCSDDVAILKLFPGIKLAIIRSILNSAKGIIIESFGAGNASTNTEFTLLLSQKIQEGKIIMNISQCLHGKAVRGQYETNEPFEKAGVICGKDMTTESAITKLMFLLGLGLTDDEIKAQLQTNLRGEITN
ncbi:MAG TPA: type I asparaginase [Flavobacteriales bacterium]|nr:type I asparaginase [Flavobacteriales bacterium]